MAGAAKSVGGAPSRASQAREMNKRRVVVSTKIRHRPVRKEKN